MKSKETILITGGTGFIGKELKAVLQDNYNLKFLTRAASSGDKYHWNPSEGVIDENAFLDIDHIIHLAGNGIAEKRWNTARKKEIYASRIDTADFLRDELSTKGLKIKSFICASGISYYPNQTSGKRYTEEDAPGSEFLCDVCIKWEAAAQKFRTNGLAEKVVSLRIGVVLGNGGGALQRLVTPIKFFVGAPIGTGKQAIPWIHRTDLCRMIAHCLDQNKNGVFNAVAPTQDTNTSMTKTIAKVLNKPLFLPNVPAFVIKALFGEMSILILECSPISSDKIQKAGFEFKFKELDSALRNILLDEN